MVVENEHMRVGVLETILHNNGLVFDKARNELPMKIRYISMKEWENVPYIMNYNDCYFLGPLSDDSKFVVRCNQDRPTQLCNKDLEESYIFDQESKILEFLVELNQEYVDEVLKKGRSDWKLHSAFPKYFHPDGTYKIPLADLSYNQLIEMRERFDMGRFRAEEVFFHSSCKKRGREEAVSGESGVDDDEEKEAEPKKRKSDVWPIQVSAIADSETGDKEEALDTSESNCFSHPID